jgi:hypothetical protein
VLVKWVDTSESRIPLKDMKESHPVETAEFAKARGIADEPAFAWWVPYTLRKRDVILSKLKARIQKTLVTRKYQEVGQSTPGPTPVRYVAIPEVHSCHDASPLDTDSGWLAYSTPGSTKTLDRLRKRFGN